MNTQPLAMIGAWALCAACAHNPEPQPSRAGAAAVRNTTTVEMYPASETRQLRLAQEDRALSTPPEHDEQAAARSAEMGSPWASSMDKRQIQFDEPSRDDAASDDGRITERIRQALQANPSLSSSTKSSSQVTCLDGRVTLRGTVTSQRERDAIEALARREAGVHTVDNQLEIQ